MPHAAVAPIDDQCGSVQVIPQATRDHRRALEIVIPMMCRRDLREVTSGLPLRNEKVRVLGAFDRFGVLSVNVQRVVGLGGDGLFESRSLFMAQGWLYLA